MSGCGPGPPTGRGRARDGILGLHATPNRLRDPAHGPCSRRSHLHQHLRPQLRRALCRQRPRARRADREDQHRPPQVDARDAAPARVRARVRPGRAGQPSRPAPPSSAPGGSPRQRAIRADRLGRGAGRGGPAAPARARHLWSRRHPRLLAHRQPVDAARPRTHPAPAAHARRLHGAVDEHLGRGRGLRRARHLRGQGRLQERRPRADRLRQLAADAHVGVEPGRRHLRHRHPAISEAGQEAGRALHLRRPAGHPHQPRAGRRARLHPPVDRHRRPRRHGLRDRQRGTARSGLSRPPRARLRRGTPAARRPGRRLLPHLPDGPRGRRAQDAGVGGGDHRHPGRHPAAAGDRVRHHQAGGAANRLRAGPDHPRRAVPPGRLRAGRHDRQRRRPRRQRRHQQRRHRPRRLPPAAGRPQPGRRPRRLLAPGRPAWNAARPAATRPT